jgi:hypothetical protein
MILGA